MPANKTPKITASELDIMVVLWASDRPLPASAITDQLSKTKNWSPRTVNTLLARLNDKQIIHAEKDVRRFLYAPLVSRREYAGGSTGSLIDRLFEGRTAPLVAHLAKTRGLSKTDIEEIEALLKSLKAPLKEKGGDNA